MRVVLDACVLFPTVLREILIGLARRGLFEPVWSPRILEEWARACGKLGPVAVAQAGAEIATLEAQFPRASVPPRAGDMARLYLPDVNDVHVLATALASSADLVLTLNAKDFPRQTLRFEGVERQAPDEFLMDLWCRAEEDVTQVVKSVHDKACEISGETLALRALLKRARLPRLGKVMDRGR